MIYHLLLSLVATTSASATNGASAGHTDLNTADVRQMCVEAIEGDISAEKECIKVIRRYADAMLVDMMNPEFQSTCLVVDRIDETDLIWIYMDWLRDHPQTQNRPASTTINAAILEKLPCGWQLR